MTHRHVLDAGFCTQEEGLLGGAKVGLLHGRLSGDEKAAGLAAFASGETPVLISTTVIEVRCTAPAAHCQFATHVFTNAAEDWVLSDSIRACDARQRRDSLS